MPEFHAEPSVHLAGVSATSVLIAWGAFYFRVRSRGPWKLAPTDEFLAGPIDISL